MLLLVMENSDCLPHLDQLYKVQHVSAGYTEEAMSRYLRIRNETSADKWPPAIHVLAGIRRGRIGSLICGEENDEDNKHRRKLMNLASSSR